MFLFLSYTAVVLGENSRNGKENVLPDWALGGFKRPQGVNPIISPNEKTNFFCPVRQDSVPWESNDTFNPGAVVYDNKIVVLYRAEDKSGVRIGRRTSRIGYASSNNGTDFDRNMTPVLYPDNDNQTENEWPGGCEDPRVAVTDGGLYVMIYTQWNRKIPRLAVATSRDLMMWEKHGPIFSKALDGRFSNMKCKSASIVTEIVKGKQVIKKINGKYFMYWGENNVYAAISDNRGLYTVWACRCCPSRTWRYCPCCRADRDRK